MVRGQTGELGDVGVGGVLEEHDQPPLRVREIGGGVDLGEQFAGEPDGGDLTIDITSGEPGAQACPNRGR